MQIRTAPKKPAIVSPVVVPQVNQVTVTFPARSTFATIGRVSVGGLATRLSLDITTVEELRLAADAAVRQLAGEGHITVTSQWGDEELTVRLENPAAELDHEVDLELDPAALLEAHVETIIEPPSRIFLRVVRQHLDESSDDEEDEMSDEEE